MTPFYTDDWLTLYGGDCLDVMREMPADSVDCVVTSPPYWGLRDYGTATWAGGEAECDHIASYGAGRPGRETPGGRGGSFPHNDIPHKDTCGRCGATRIDSQLGLERTPEEYVANMVNVFREVRRVLKPSGTCWLNLGDSYVSTAPGTRNAPAAITGSAANERAQMRPPTPSGLKPKDLVGIPWRVAFALQADGWYLRSDIIWSKSNPMPESVTDRPTKSHEYLFLLTKSPRYYFDADAVREENAGSIPWGASITAHEKTQAAQGDNHGPNSFHKGLSKERRVEYATNGRNIRSVWTIATRPYPGAHFAVFPPELPERCIKAGSSEKGVCPECGAPWVRVVERAKGVEEAADRPKHLQSPKSTLSIGGGGHGAAWAERGSRTQTTGWNPICIHGAIVAADIRDRPGIAYQGQPSAPPQPATILDPFGGSGTVGMVANRLSRRAILIDLNPTYLVQQMKRNAQTPLGLTEGDAA